jgi:selenoprotein W-related protein
LTDKLLTTLKRRISALELEPSSGGCFELTADGKLLYSKLQTGEFPNEEALVASVMKLVQR